MMRQEYLKLSGSGKFVWNGLLGKGNSSTRMNTDEHRFLILGEVRNE